MTHRETTIGSICLQLPRLSLSTCQFRGIPLSMTDIPHNLPQVSVVPLSLTSTFYMIYKIRPDPHVLAPTAKARGLSRPKVLTTARDLTKPG